VTKTTAASRRGSPARVKGGSAYGKTDEYGYEPWPTRCTFTIGTRRFCTCSDWITRS